MVETAQVPLGSLLVEMGFIDEGQLEHALDEQKQSGLRLGKILIQSGRITEDRLVHALSRQLGIEACDPIMTPVHGAVLAMVPAAVAFERRVLPVARQRDGNGEVLYVATADPLDEGALEALREVVPDTTQVRWMLAGETEMDLALARHYGAAPAKGGGSASARVGSSSSAEVTPMPSGTPVITGVPVSAPPRRPGASSLASLSSTGDIFAALQQAVDVSEPPVAPETSSPPEGGPAPSHPSIDLARLQGSLYDDVSEEILEAEEVVESGIHPSEAPAEPSDPLPLASASFDAAPSAPEGDAAPSPPPAAWPTPAPTLSTGSWGDLLAGDSDADDEGLDQEALRSLAAEATELPSATDSIPAIPASMARAPADAPPAEPVEPPTELELDPQTPTAVPSGAEEPPAATLWPAPAAPEGEDEPPAAFDGFAPPEVDEAPEDPQERTQEDLAGFMDAEGLAPLTHEPDTGLFDPELQPSLSGSLDLPIEDDFEEIVPGEVEGSEVGLDGRPLDAAPAEAEITGPPRGRAASDEARALVRRFVAGGDLSEDQTAWVLRLVAGLALQGGLLDDEGLEPILGRIGPPPA